ncbi:MAG: protease modulator HflC [Rhodanobacteraceae bacterium]
MKVISAIIAVVIVLLGANSMFIVSEGHAALVLQFGRIESATTEPGLHFKLPFMQQIVKFDTRILTLDAQPERYFTSEKKSVNVDFYVKWRIADINAYYRASAGDELQAAQRLTPIIKDALRFEFNARPLDELISGSRQDITEHVREQADKAARKTFGIAIVDVRIKRIDLPDEVSQSVYNRMSAERLNLANKLRSTGNESSETIRADADRQRQVLIADAQRDATRVRGEGDAKASQIYAQAYDKDPSFYAFYRSLDAYRHAFDDGKNVLVLDPDTPFLRYFENTERTEKH